MFSREGQLIHDCMAHNITPKRMMRYNNTPMCTIGGWVYVIGQIWHVLFKFEMHIDGSFLLISGGASSIAQPKICCQRQFADVQSWVLRELWLIFGGGENNICHVVYAYEMLTNDVCCCARVWVGPWLGPTLCDYIHDNGFAFNSHAWMHRTANLVINH